MKYKKLRTLSNPVFRRVTGVKKQTFTLMLKIIKNVEVNQKKKKEGRPKKTIC